MRDGLMPFVIARRFRALINWLEETQHPASHHLEQRYRELDDLREKAKSQLDNPTLHLIDRAVLWRSGLITNDDFGDVWHSYNLEVI